MIVQYGKCRIELLEGNITRQSTDAIVNAANEQLAGGGGVDGAIHAAAGPSLMEQTRTRYPGGCPTGDAVVTTSGKLASRFVFHAVGPIWQGGRRDEPEKLAAAYRKCLELAIQHDCSSIAFPALSTGAFGYPIDLAAEVALGTSIEFVKQHQQPGVVRFVLFGAGALGAHSRVLESLSVQ